MVLSSDIPPEDVLVCIPHLYDEQIERVFEAGTQAYVATSSGLFAWGHEIAGTTSSTMQLYKDTLADFHAKQAEHEWEKQFSSDSRRFVPESVIRPPVCHFTHNRPTRMLYFQVSATL